MGNDDLCKSLLCGKMEFCGFAFHAFVLSTWWIPAVCSSSVIPAGMWGDSPEGQTFCSCHRPINFSLSCSQQHSPAPYREFWKYQIKIRWQTSLVKLLLAVSSIFEGGFPSEEVLVLAELIQMSVYEKLQECQFEISFCKTNFCLAQTLHCLRVCQGFLAGIIYSKGAGLWPCWSYSDWIIL